MPRLFVSNAIENKTCIQCRLSLEGKQEKNGIKKVYVERMKFKACSRMHEFSALYSFINKKLQAEATRLDRRELTMYLKIRIKGEVNGSSVEQHFEDLSEFRDWLVENNLIERMRMCLR